VDVICAYLRMPYTLPGEQPPTEDAPTEAHTRYENRRQERQVRLTAQHVLLHNMRIVAQRRRRWWHRAPPPAPAWPGIRLNLTGALMVNFSLLECQLDFADFTRAKFTGDAKFGNTQFTGGWAYFVSAQFIDWADFEGALFTGGADFRDAQFTIGAHFNNAHFPDAAIFGGAQFADSAFFMGAQFRGALFGGAQFNGGSVLRMRSLSAWPTSRAPSSGGRRFPKDPLHGRGRL
jgi:uncharacterized protein YjbI with pentapeptide repeats